MKWWGDKLLVVLWGIVLATLPFQNSINSLSIIVLGIATIGIRVVKPLSKTPGSVAKWGLLLFSLLFLSYAITAYFNAPHPDTMADLVRKIPLVAIPFLWMLSGLEWKPAQLFLYAFFATGLFVAGTIMICNGAYKAIINNDLSLLFYHHLAGPVPISIIYCSWYLCLAVFWSLEVGCSARLKWFLNTFFSILLLLGSSKLFIAMALLLGLGYTLKHRRWLGFRPWHLILPLGLVLLLYPVSLRFTELKDLHLEQVTEDSFTYDSPINGANLRLLQFRFGIEILADDRIWLTGAGLANNQQMLNSKYYQYGLYTGNGTEEDIGFRKYNFHNQWMETTVATGVPGLLWLILLFVLGAAVLPNRSAFFTSFLLLSMGFMFTESFLERQQGIVPFTLFMGVLLSRNTLNK